VRNRWELRGGELSVKCSVLLVQARLKTMGLYCIRAGRCRYADEHETRHADVSGQVLVSNFFRLTVLYSFPIEGILMHI
jgi:aspartate/tyrosine/aromatic aminotransferase